MANIHLEQAVDLLTTGTCGTPGHLGRVSRDLQQVQYVMDLMGTGIDVNLHNMRYMDSHLSQETQEKDQANNNINKNYNEGCSVDNNNLQSIEENSHDSQESPQKTKYNRRELKRLISTPKKAGRPYSFSLYCNLCGAGFPSPLSLRTHMAGKHSESTFACNLCPQRFFSESSLNKHFVAKHSSSDSKKSRKPPSPSTKPVDDVGDVGQTKNRAKCPHCSKIFATNVGRHTEWFLNSDNCYICST